MRFFITGVSACAVAVILVSMPLEAHHSFTSFWHMDQTRQITGVVTSVKLVNPHPEMVVEVTNPDGTKENWTITGRATGTGILRAGWTNDTLPIGTRVTIEGAPSRREGAKALAAGRIVLTDGSELSFGGGGGIPAG